MSRVDPKEFYLTARQLIGIRHSTGEWQRSLTHAELDALADEAVSDLNELDRQNYEAAGLPAPPEAHTRQDLTCHHCPSAGKCEFVYDIYNTSGDCLASK